MHAILFHIGPVPIRAYGFMLWVGFMIGLFYTARAARRTDIKPEHVVDVALYALIAGIVFAHLASVILDLPYYWKNPSEISGLWSGILSSSGGLRGLSFHGGLIGGVGAAYIYTRRKGINFLAMADLCSPAVALAYGVTRIGCFLNGCCYGIPTNLPWAVRFHVDPFSTALTPPSHPTQIYAMLASFLIFRLLLSVDKRRSYTGQVFLSYLAMYSVYRFLIEIFRKGVTAEVALFGLTQAQLVSLLMLGVTLPILWMRHRNKKDSAVRDVEERSCLK